jgi:predicted flap endonuclease-1-like 5' DNA nuclease
MLLNILLLQIFSGDCFWWLLLAMLLPLLLGLLLGYWLWSRYKRLAGELERERDTLKAKIVDWEKEYASLKYKYDELHKDNRGLRASLNSAQADIAVLKGKLSRALEGAESTESGLAVSRAAAPAATPEEVNLGAFFQPANLQIVEGIGPKIEAVLKNAGIANWKALAGKSPEELRAILGAAGPAYRLANPDSWPRQAQLAAEGKWAKLVEYQKLLDDGRAGQGDFDTPSKVEIMASKVLESDQERSAAPARAVSGFDVFKSDDLQVIEGIGPKIEELLKNSGINNWTALAAKSPDDLHAILEAGGPNFRMHDPATWPRQAQLAAQGQWAELGEYQKLLDTGRDAGSLETPSKAEKHLTAVLGFKGADPNDLQIIEGVGPKIEEVLKNAGIKTWADLARTTADEIRDLLDEAGDNFRLADPSTWPRQAYLAAYGKWKELKEFQDFLQGGRDPGKR